MRNNTKVIKARLFGHKTTEGSVEILLNKPVDYDSNDSEQVWECLTKPGLKTGQQVEFEGSKLIATCLDDSAYTRIIKFNQSRKEFLKTLTQIGEIPLPPYIKNPHSQQLDNLYQTLYAENAGSVASPTAGLHFTPEVEKALIKKGVTILNLTLHVGLGTFLPVKNEDIKKHQMHSEWFSLSPDVAGQINQAKASQKRIIAVGTTTTRVLEACAFFDQNREIFQLKPQTAETDIFIFPEYKFKIIDGLITNFHLPKSTLLMLVGAFTSYPNSTERFESFQKSLIGRAYQTAIDSNYRFFSFGDAMLII